LGLIFLDWQKEASADTDEKCKLKSVTAKVLLNLEFWLLRTRHKILGFNAPESNSKYLANT
jgi:hypothetical protein